MAAAPTGPLPAIDTTRLRLRRVERADLPDLLAINGDDAVTRYLPYASWRTMDDAGAWYERMAGLVKSGAAAEQFVVVHRESARVIGTCLLFKLDAASARAEIGYVLGRAWWGQGLMAEALRAFVARSFEHFELRRLEADIDPLNLASARLLERLGFEREGLLRQRYLSKGQLTDAALYGLLRGDAIRPVID